ncbi:hypothetical protein [Polaribacter butkevichii]|uniref:hypothetical protein n=1 Tax=Polaribacter butkevichii TaxID=218490 RepID=UPI0011AFF101|nr:hypothetical protein [Polaribacter butkevichii]
MILCSLWITCFSQSIFTQNKTLKGKVTDVETQLTILQVRVQTTNKTLLTTTNEVSKFSITPENFYNDYATNFVVKYAIPKYQIGVSLENLFDKEWREALFYNSSLLQGKTIPVDDIHFTPGTPFLAKISLTHFF